MAYFEQLGPDRFLPTEHVSGAWDEAQQHIGPSIGLLTHVVEAEHGARRPDRLTPTRLSFEIWGTAPLEEMTARVRVVRPGRTIELVEGELRCAGRTLLTLRAWLLQRTDTHALAASPFPRIPAPEEMEPFDATSVWPGGYIASAEVRRRQQEPGRAQLWVRTRQDLLDGVPVSPLARAASLFDMVNGLTVRADPREVAFPNVDLTAHLLRTPAPGWLGYDTSVSFGDEGAGLTHSVVHDADGPLGSLSQALTVRPN